jgi:hypothetical protein
MRYRKLGPDDDYSFGNGQLDFWQDVPEAVAQSVKTRLLLWLGEWFLNIEDGTQYMQGILGKYSQELADTTIQDRVITTTGVTDIQNYASIKNPDTRSISVEFDIDTIYGPTPVQVNNYANY